MKLMLITDLEFVAGVLNYGWCGRWGSYFDQGKRLLTHEVKAAVDGLFAGCAIEIIILDGHGQGGIDPEILDGRAQLQRRSEAGYPLGLNAGIAGFGWIGQHAKAGTDYSHLTHTQSFNYIDLTINGISISEYGQVAFCAMELGIPCVLAFGEKAFCSKASELTPGVVEVAVKRGLLNQDGLTGLLMRTSLPLPQRCVLDSVPHIRPLLATIFGPGIRIGSRRVGFQLHSTTQGGRM